jgi:protein-tyrosine phosphatase
MRFLVKQAGVSARYEIESAGTSTWHNGESPHAGSIAAAGAHGIDISDQVSTLVRGAERGKFDLFVAMDTQNRADLLEMGIPKHQVVLLLDFGDSEGPRDVPDPYYAGGFEGVFELVYKGCEGLLEHLES